MSYNTRQQNNRNVGRNSRGGFVPGGTLRPEPAAAVAAPAPAPRPLTGHQTYEVPTPQESQSQADYEEAYDSPLKSEDEEMREEGDGDAGVAVKAARQGPAFKIRLSGVKKISNKERRRRQNQLLRRLATPKNALMCINEMIPHAQVANQFKVVQTDSEQLYYSCNSQNFCAELSLGGISYKGYGENKMAARNAAAEQAIRDLMLKKMAVKEATAAANDAQEGEEQDEDPLPMIQLLSFALHKLFSEWEGSGHRVPMLPRQRLPQGDQVDEEAPAASVSGTGGRPKKAPKPLPSNASSMHPAMLLTVLRPLAAYREVCHEGNSPQNFKFTMAVDVDGNTFIGRAGNKKEARKNAARAACKALLGIVFDDESDPNAPTSNPNPAKP